MRLSGNHPSRNVALGASVSDVAEFPCADVDVLAFDVENNGAGLVSDFQVHGRISKEAPYRDITPASFVVQGYDVLFAAEVSPVGLAAGAFSQFALNVSTFESIRLRASGASASLKVNAAAYSD